LTSPFAGTVDETVRNVPESAGAAAAATEDKTTVVAIVTARATGARIDELDKHLRIDFSPDRLWVRSLSPDLRANWPTRIARSA
jgi:hypothetical protein